MQRAKRANEVSDSPAPELSPTLVLVLTCLTVAPLVCPPTIAHIIKIIKQFQGSVDISSRLYYYGGGCRYLAVE